MHLGCPFLALLVSNLRTPLRTPLWSHSDGVLCGSLMWQFTAMYGNDAGCDFPFTTLAGYYLTLLGMLRIMSPVGACHFVVIEVGLASPVRQCYQLPKSCAMSVIVQ